MDSRIYYAIPIWYDIFRALKKNNQGWSWEGGGFKNNQLTSSTTPLLETIHPIGMAMECSHILNVGERFMDSEDRGDHLFQ